MRYFKLAVSTLAAAVFIYSQSFAQETKKDQPNIIFILTDDLGYGDLGVFYQKLRESNKDRSEPWMFTPALDKLALSGATLTHHYCPAPVCAPSRASLLLGVSQGHANIRDNQFDKALENNHTIATALKTLGYKTAVFGKWGLQGDKKWEPNGAGWPAHPLNRGFDYFLGYMRHTDGHEHYPKEGVYRGQKQVWENRTDISDGLDKSYTADLWTAAAKNWIINHRKGADSDQPFFMYLSYDTPHAVLELPTQAYPDGGGLSGGLQCLGKPGQMINTASGKVDSWMHPDYVNATYDHDGNPSTTETQWPDVYKRYATSVRRIDNQIEDLVKLLKDMEIDENTFIVFSSDNGPSLESYLPDAKNDPDFFNSFGPFDGTKRDLWEGGLRVPTIAVWPKHISANQIITQPASLYDWLPTFTDAGGMPGPVRSDGVSLLPVLTRKGKQVTPAVYVEYFNNSATPDLPEFESGHRNRKRNQMQLIRIGDHVGVRYDIKSHADNFEIYNVVKDPKETTNLAGTSRMRILQQQMKDRVLQSRVPDSASKRPYDQELIPAKEVKRIKPGLHRTSYKGKFPWLPQVASLKPSSKGKILDLQTSDITGEGVVYFYGYLKIPADGEYTFSIIADKSAHLRVHDASVIDADFNYAPGDEREGRVQLKAGLHPIHLYYTTTGSENEVASLNWKGPGIVKQKIPASVFFRGSRLIFN